MRQEEQTMNQRRGVDNASLIAKAPEMYKELERLANEMQAASSQGDDVSPDWLDKRIARARALLREINHE